MGLRDGRSFVFAFGLMILIAAVFVGCSQTRRDIPRVRSGVLDLRDYDFAERHPIRMEGDWEFYWERFIGDRQIPLPENVEYMAVPRSWNGETPEGELPPGHGFASYRLTLLLPENTPDLGLKILEMATTCEIFVDGVSIYRAGVPGTTAELSRPGFYPGVVPLPAADTTVVITVHISNFHYRTGGMWEPIVVGPYQSLHNLRDRSLMRDAVVIGAILFIGLYHLTVFVLRRDRKWILWFGLLCVLIALRISVTGERVMVSAFPEIPWTLLPRLEYITFYLGVAVFIHYIAGMFSERWPLRLRRILTGVCLVFLIPTLVLPVGVFTYTLIVFQIWTALLAVYAIFDLIRATLSRVPGALFFLSIFVVFFGTVVNDILYADEILYTFYMISYGMVLFIFAQAVHIARLFNLDFSLVKMQSAALKEADAIINSSPAVVIRWSATADMSIEYVSANVFRLTGYTASDFTDGEVAFSSIIHKDDRERVLLETERFFNDRSSGNFIHGHYRILTKEGAVRWVSDRAILERDSAGNIVNFRGIVEDVTELEKANRELSAYRDRLEELVRQRTRDLEIAKISAERANRAKSQFLASMSHELRTPLNHVIGFTDLVAAGNAGPVSEKQREFLGDAVTSARDLLGLINGILDIAKIEAGEPDLRIERIHIPGFIAEIVRSFRTQISGRGITIEPDIVSIPDVFFADPQRLKQILVNLITNAVKFSPDNSPVLVRVSTHDSPRNGEPAGIVRFQIIDIGYGISTDERESIFESFEQGRSALHSTLPGAGLGLSISRTLVEQHGGSIWVEDNPSGRGSIFIFTIPSSQYPGTT